MIWQLLWLLTVAGRATHEIFEAMSLLSLVLPWEEVQMSILSKLPWPVLLGSLVPMSV
jgi:hypothetical protein